MNIKAKVIGTMAVGMVGGVMLVNTASAADILCQSSDNNHMLIDDSQVSACLDAGLDNPSLTGNPGNDVFLTGEGGDFEFAGKHNVDAGDDSNIFNIGATQGPQDVDGSSDGTWFFDASFWDDFDTGAIGFVFGTGGEEDNWFVYQLVPDISSGQWEFVNVHNVGGGLSAVALYGIRDDLPPPPAEIPAPGVLGLFGLGLVGLGWVMLRRRTGR